MSQIYVIGGNPIDLQKKKIIRGHSYYKQQRKQEAIRESMTEQHGSKDLFRGPLRMRVVFFLPLPHHKKKYNEGQHHSIRPNLSSLIKIAEDAGYAILYKDDASIADVQAVKKYSAEPRTEFTIQVINEE